MCDYQLPHRFFGYSIITPFLLFTYLTVSGASTVVRLCTATKETPDFFARCSITSESLPPLYPSWYGSLPANVCNISIACFSKSIFPKGADAHLPGKLALLSHFFSNLCHTFFTSGSYSNNCQKEITFLHRFFFITQPSGFVLLAPPSF